MPFQIIRNDITRMHVDAIVNPTNTALYGVSATDGAVHRAGGPELDAECARIGYCGVGDAVITGGYLLPCRYVIHTVGPTWQGGVVGESIILRSCYRKALSLAKEYGCESVAFPLISSGTYGYPKEEALNVANEEIRAFLDENEMEITLVVFDRDTTLISEKLYAYITKKIDDLYVKKQEEEEFDSLLALSEHDICDSACLNAPSVRPGSLPCPGAASTRELGICADAADEPVPKRRRPLAVTGSSAPSVPRKKGMTLVEKLKELDEGFGQAVLRLIDEKGMTDPQFYKGANMTKQSFSKIRCNPGYHPSRGTALACVFALRLTVDEADALLRKAGYGFSNSYRQDIVIMDFMNRRNYNMFELNETLFDLDLEPLGTF